MDHIETTRHQGGDVILERPNAQAIDAALNTYPYFARLRGVADARALVDGMRAPAAPPTAISRIEVDPAKMAEAERSGATRVSRSAIAMEAHTDSTFLARPHEVLAMSFIRPSKTGGESIVIPVDSILARLDDEAHAGLARVPFRFNDQHKPILEERENGSHIRFNWLQIEKSAGAAGLSCEQAELARSLRDAIAATSEQFRFRAKAGETVLINNRRALHSRTAFPPNSDRLMMRYRCHSDRVR